MVDIIFILIAYFASNQILAQFKDNPNLYIIGGLIMSIYGLISYTQLKKKFVIDEERDIKRKKLALKEEVANANKFLNELDK